ncbi:FadR/GntR family transcriptional regulator [Parafrigoribacterium soli]|uniref:FadR/GntR family transcriptional regulator n=1 Tax=Parafrigoribacterium soli TaxID=3144663 RepID=UPI0032F03BFF
MKRKDPRAWGVVLESIEQDMLSGRLHPGDRLPPEHALASTLGVRRGSVREALRVLEVLGLVRNDGGDDSGAVIVASPSGGMGSLMRLQVAARGIQVADVVNTRLLLETSVVKELAAHTDTVDLTAITQLLDAMEAPELTQGEFLALDAQFHLSLAEAADNQVVTAVMAGLRQSIANYALQGALGMVGWATLVERLRSEHRGIAMAIIEGNGPLAAERAHNHISNYYSDAHLVPSTPYRD